MTNSKKEDVVDERKTFHVSVHGSGTEMCGLRMSGVEGVGREANGGTMKRSG